MGRADSSRTHFEDILTNVLKVYYPEIPDNKPFIEDRTGEAYDLYIELINTGTSPHAAYELALKVLFDSL
ncbi:DUF1896 family protein [Dysgonomonas sp.]